MADLIALKERYAGRNDSPSQGGGINVEAYLAHYGYGVKNIKANGTSTIYTLDQCPFDPNHAGGEASIIKTSEGKLLFQCFHDSCKGRTWKEARQIISGSDSLAPFMDGGSSAKSSVPRAGKETATEEEKKDLQDAILIAEAFKNLPETPRVYYLKPFIWRGNIILISGARGVGKTNFAICLASATSGGGQIGPWKAEGNTYCLYLDAEMMVTDIQERLEMLDVPEGIPLFIYSEALAYQLGLPRAHLMNEEWREKFKQILIDLGIQVLFLDNVASLTPGLDENSKQEWDPINQWLIELRFLGISVVLIHHLGKSGTQRGTSGREDNIDISIDLLKPSDYSPEDGCRFIAHFDKHRIPQRDLHLIGDTEFKLIPGEDGRHYYFAHANPKTEAKKECLKLFSDGYDQKSICEQAGLSKGYVSKLKKSFIDDGLLSNKGELTPKGWSFLHPQKLDEVGNQ